MIDKIPNPKINYNPEIKTTHGYFFCPECGNEFYGGGEALHTPECSTKGYEECIYNFGDSEIDRIQSGFNSFGFSWMHGAWIELKILRDFGTIVDLQKQIEEYKEKLIGVKGDEKARPEYEALRVFFTQ